MSPSTSQSTISSDQGLGIEELLKAAFARTKERFLSYVLAYLLSFGIYLGAFLCILLLGGLNFLIWTLIKSSVLTGILGFISALVSLLALIYIGSWTGLAVIYSLISPAKLGVIDIYKSVRPLVLSYFKVMAVTSLFFIGIFPFGLLSVFILLILWGIWGMFLSFVFLEKKETGLRNLFMSKAIINTKFWGVVLRVVIVYAAYFLIFYVLGLAQSEVNSSGFMGILTFIFGVVATPFITSYFYEMYRNLSHPKEIASNNGWIGLSVIGWVINILLIIALSSTASQVLETINKNLTDRLNSIQPGGPYENRQQNPNSDNENTETEESIRQMMNEAYDL